MFRDKLVSKGCRVSKVPRVFKEILDLVYRDIKAFKVSRVSSVLLVVRVLKASRVFKQHKVLKDFRVCKV